MVASTHWLASASGMAVLEGGGNAFDAAVAAGLVLQVVEPHLNGTGGDAVVLIYSAERDEVIVVDGQGPAPAAATIDHFAGLDLGLIPGTGLLPACVPGAFGAWLTILEEFGTMGFDDVASYALAYARFGYPVLPRISEAIGAMESVFRTEWPTSAAIYLADGVPPTGSLFANHDLADTFERLIEESRAGIDGVRKAFYEGFVADAIDAFVASSEVMDVTGERHRGLLTGEDMAAWRSRLETPVVLDYGPFTLCKAGPWTQGPVFLQQLSLLAGFDLGAMDDLDLIHTVVECAKLAFADRESHYGDPEFVDVPLARLLDSAYAADRRALITDKAASSEQRVAHSAISPSLDGGVGAGEPTRGDTCHVDVVDRWGNMVAATPSGGWLQSSPVVPGLGFPLGTRAQMFWLDESHPNSLQPGKRPRTTLTPTIALRDGAPYLAFGTPGGDSQDQWALNFFLRHVHGGLNLQEAIDAPNWHSNHFPSSFWPRAAAPGQMEVEDRVGAEVLDGLRARGHEVIVADGWSLGRVSAVARLPGGVLKAAANPRGMQGYAVGR
jgi:gamma-glutamyltranspeptidase/glutathione hydrolase